MSGSVASLLPIVACGQGLIALAQRASHNGGLEVYDLAGSIECWRAKYLTYRNLYLRGYEIKRKSVVGVLCVTIGSRGLSFVVQPLKQ